MEYDTDATFVIGVVIAGIIFSVVLFFVGLAIGERMGEGFAYKNLLESKATSFCEEDNNATLVDH